MMGKESSPTDSMNQATPAVNLDIPEKLIRKKAEAELALKANGVPTSKLEDWKYTQVKFPEAKATTAIPAFSASDVAEAKKLADQYTIAGLNAVRFVFLDGVLVESPKALPVGLSASSLSTGYRSTEPAALDTFARFDSLARKSYANFDYVNTLNAVDGLAFTVESKKSVAEPIELVFVSSAKAAGTISASRVLIQGEEESTAVFIERHLSLGSADYFSMPVIEVFCAKGANLSLLKIQEEQNSTHLAGTLLEQKDASIFHSAVVSFGSKLCRNDIIPDLKGSKCECYLNGLTVLNGAQHVDNSTVIQHIEPDSFSREHYKGIYGGTATGVFSGTIFVHSEAQKTNAIQSNQSLLLSPDAQIKTRPQLKIYADDVKCTHGATIGELDENALFYLRSRGIPAAEAKGLLIQAFAGEVVELLPLQPLQDYVMKRVLEKLAE